MEMDFHGLKNLLTQLVLLQDVAEGQDCRLIRDPPLPGKLTALQFDHFFYQGLDGAEQCVATARRSKLM